MSLRLEKRLSKWTPSTTASVVSTCSAPRVGVTTAASSPGPITRESGGAGRRPRMCSISARSPGRGASTRELNGARLPDHGDLDLPWILQLVLDPFGDVPRQPNRRFVRDLFALDDDADFAAGLECKGLRDPVERIGNPFELFEALHVGLEDVAPGAGSRRGHGISRLDDHGLKGGPVDIHMVSGDGHQDRFALAVLFQEVEAQFEMRALEVTVDRLSDVMQEGRAGCDLAIESELLGHDAGQERDFLRMVQHVLAVAGAELEASHQPQHLRVDVEQAE